MYASHRSRSCPRQLGGGLIEVLIAVLVFATGMMALVSAQVAGKMAAYEAQQRSTATALARDIVERMRANPGQLPAYVAANLGDQAARLPGPVANCAAADCVPAELASYDLWQWESLLLGAAETRGISAVGGLVAPRACIFHDRGAVSVAISWRGLGSASKPRASYCGNEATGLYDDPGAAAGNNLRRRQMILSTYVGADQW